MGVRYKSFMKLVYKTQNPEDVEHYKENFKDFWFLLDTDYKKYLYDMVRTDDTYNLYSNGNFRTYLYFGPKIWKTI